MGNWKELGEVPDSDDEILDSQGISDDSQIDDGRTADAFENDDLVNSVIAHGLHSSSQKHGQEKSASVSPEMRFTPQRKTLVSTELLSPCFGQVIPVAESDDEINIVESESQGLPDLNTESCSATIGACDQQKVEKDAQLDARPRTAQPPTEVILTDQALSSPLSSLSSFTLSPSPPFEALRVAESLPEASPSRLLPLPESPKFRLGFVRSLRPRKPIQQHPYLLENAQYTKFMKSHGVKPVRVTYSSPQIDTPAPDDSQGHDLVNENSLADEADLQCSVLRDDSQFDLLNSSQGYNDGGQLLVSPGTSTPARRLLQSSSRRSVDDGTDDTSLADEDEFPSPKTLMLRRRQRLSGGVLKQRISPKTSSNSKKARRADTTHQEEISSTWIPVRIELSPVSSPVISGARHPEACPPGFPNAVHNSLMSSPGTPTAEKFSLDDDAGDIRRMVPEFLTSPSGENNESQSESQSDSDVIRRTGRKIRGVLPASWLRLDQSGSRSRIDRAVGSSRRSVHHMDQAPQRGVALPVQHNSGFVPEPFFAFDESDDDDGNDVEEIGARSRASRVEPWPEDEDDMEVDSFNRIMDDDDVGSVVEEDVIDRMASGTKRRSPANGGCVPKRRKTGTSSLFNGISGQKTRQPKITKMLQRPRAPTSTKTGRGIQRRHGTTHRHKHSSVYTDRGPLLPPMLSIVDFDEPAAPNFVRIAARTARSRANLGKTSPSRKIINLGSRNDNIDALSVLHDWRAGRIQPRIQTELPMGRLNAPVKSPLQEVSVNATKPTIHNNKSTPATHLPARPSLRQTRIHDDLAQAKLRSHPRTISLKIGDSRTKDAVMRPAQLESLTQDRPRKSDFFAKKRALDVIYRKRRKDAPILPNIHLEHFIDDYATPPTPDSNDRFGCSDFHADLDAEPESEPRREASIQGSSRRQSHFRKQSNPKQIDTTAPRFVRALDPIPLELEAATQDPMGHIMKSESEKLLGLGPFGSCYPQHFDIFPLDSGVFFHPSTVIGSGLLCKAVGTPAAESSQPILVDMAVSFQLDERILAWHDWNDDVSSEFGILFDWLSDTLLLENAVNAHTREKVARAVRFIAEFVQTMTASPNTKAEVRKSLFLRTLEVVSSFAGRVEAADPQGNAQGSDTATKCLLAASSGVLLVVISILRACRDSSACLVDSFQVEELLKRLATLSIKILWKCGFGDIRTSYDDIQRPQCRDRGIGNDKQLLISWVVVMQVLEYARIPKAGFWDVAYSVMLDNFSMGTCADAGRMERLWEAMFTLLPLGEFDSSGAIQPGLRRLMPHDGWALPRQAVARVFQVYKKNPRQSPSFNAYCRAIVGRCHYLVQEWGWRRCSSIVGVIFDFYGSEDFAHLRNEEAYRSPRFLEELAGSPSLAIEPEDKCFHIFIKMLGLVMLRLRRLGLTNEMRNLIARTLPNHNRQYLKEMDIHQRDLAALRNHHDLLCTLFWAVPPELRPGTHLIEKLVMPASSHKEACLINIRSWNQLARFVIASGEDYSVFKGFISWMNNVFQQVLEQFLSAESDIQKQFMSLAQNMMQGISPHILKAMSTKNKAAAMDVLHACMVSSLDVLKHAPSLEVATYWFSSIQLEQVFTKFDFSRSESNWGILDTALDIVEHYMENLEKVLNEQYSSSADAVDPQAAEEAVLMLDHKLARSFFQLNYTFTHISWDGVSAQAPSRHVACVKRSVVLAARLASRFIHSGICHLSRFFSPGQYCIFERLPHNPGLEQRKFLPLFVSAIIHNNVFDFKDIGTNLLELWMSAIVKPQQFLAYEIQLAQTLKHHDLPYLRKAFVPTNGQAPSYSTNQAFFASAIMSMRLLLCEADGGRRPQLRNEFSRALKLVMQQMKEDLKFIKADSTQHDMYVGFVRTIVALIKSHGGDICSLDAFYYQQSQDYTPSLEDPQLQTAGIVAYGVRLGEGEATAAPQLFHYLHNNFNIALANNKLEQECKILERSMENNEVLGFMLERMLPASIRATREAQEAWPVLDMYCNALQKFLTRSDVPKDIGEANMAGMVGLLEEILAWMRSTAGSVAAGTRESGGGVVGGTRTLSCEEVHTMAQLAALASMLQPFLMTWSCLPCSPDAHSRLNKAVSGFCDFAATALAGLGTAGSSDGSGQGRDADSAALAMALLGGDNCAVSDVAVSAGAGLRDRAQVQMFSSLIVRHVRENWVVGEGYIAVRKTGARPAADVPAATTVSPGVPYGPWTLGGLVDEVRQQLLLWKLAVPWGRRGCHSKADGTASRARRLFPGRQRQ